MKFSYKFSDAIHLLAYLDIYQNGDLSSRRIADSIEANPSVVRNLMRDLKKAGLILTHQGSATPSLAKQPAKISLYDIYTAVDINHDLIHVDPNTNPACIVGGNIQTTLQDAYDRIQQAAFNEMKAISPQDIIDGILNNQQRSL